MARRSAAIRSLLEHPERNGVRAMLARVPHLTDPDLVRLADLWRNDTLVSAARAHALSPDSPLVCEALGSFDELAELFADDLAGEAAYVTLDPQVTRYALTAIRDGLAAHYAWPLLTRRERRALLAPWLAVHPRPGPPVLDLGPQSADVTALLAALPGLAGHCHDADARTDWERLLDCSFVAETERAEALERGFEVALRSGRRRLWTLVRLAAGRLLAQPCPGCRRHADAGDPELRRVTQLCRAAGCRLLVADLLPPELGRSLTAPLRAVTRRAGPSTAAGPRPPRR